MYRDEEPFPGGWESTNGQSNKNESLSLAANSCPQLLMEGEGLESILSIQSRMLVKLSLCSFSCQQPQLLCVHRRHHFTTLLSILHLLHPSGLPFQTRLGVVRKFIQMTSSGGTLIPYSQYYDQLYIFH